MPEGARGSRCSSRTVRERARPPGPTAGQSGRSETVTVAWSLGAARMTPPPTAGVCGDVDDQQRRQDEVDRLRRENLRLRQLLRLGLDDPLPEGVAGRRRSRFRSMSRCSMWIRPRGLAARLGVFMSLFRGRDDVYAVRWSWGAGSSG